MSFQNYVYILRERDHTTTCGDFIWGVYPNFKKAYERLEEFAEGSPIIDCGDKLSGTLFEVVSYKKGKVTIRKYSVKRCLLTCLNGEEFISTERIRQLEEEERKRKFTRYARFGDII